MQSQIQKYALCCWGGLSFLSLWKRQTYGSSWQPYHKSTVPSVGLDSIFWEQKSNINTLAFSNNLFILYNEINYISTTVIINWFHPLCVSDLWLNWFSGLNYCHCSFLFTEKRGKMKHLFFLCHKFESCFLVIVIYSYAICFLFSFMTFFNFRSL